MTTLARREAYAEGAPPAAGPRPGGIPGPGRFARWRGSWAVALRMARRDVRRSKGRSLLVVIMVAVPIALVSFAATSLSSSDTSGPQIIPFALGTAQAAVSEPSSTQVAQGVTATDQNYGGGQTPSAKAVPGWPAANDTGVVPGLSDASVDSAPAKALAAVIAGTVGGNAHAVATRNGSVRATWNDGATPRGRDVTIFAADGRAGLGEKLRLTSGRWPSNDSEVLVTDLGVAWGLPGAGSLSVRQNGKDRPLTIVGHAAAYDGYSQPLVGLVGLSTYDSAGVASQTVFLVFRNAPVTWADVQRLNRSGMAVTSAEVLRNPPSLSELPPSVAANAADTNQRMTTLEAGVGTVLVIVIALLVGPAFAVSAARQRRTLALAASNGATVAQLRRSVLAQALVLGALASLIGAAVGVVAAAGASNLVNQSIGSWWPALLVPYRVLAVLVLVGVFSSVVAALVPAQRLGRLDIIGVMKGQNVSRRPSRILPVIGIVAAGVGAVVLFQGIVQRSQNALVIIGGGLGLVLGVLFCVPVILVAVGRLAGRLPVSLRLAARELARQRARSVPTVAAAVGAVAALTTILVTVASDTEHQQRTYSPSALPGQGVIGLGSDPEITRRQISMVAPGLTLIEVGSLSGFSSPSSQEPTTSLMVPNAQCSPDDVTAAMMGTNPTPAQQRCSGFGDSGQSPPSVGTMPAEAIIERYHLTAAQATVIRTGGALVTDPSLTAAGKVTVYASDLANTSSTPSTPTPTTLPAVSATGVDPALGGPSTGMNMTVLIDPKTAVDHGWRAVPMLLEVADPRGPITPELEDQVNGALAGDATLQVERGFQSSNALVFAILLGAFTLLLLIVTLTSTALSLAEQRVDQATMAAVGATRATRRRITAAQSFVTSLVGTLGGVAVGLVPGIALTYPLTQVMTSSSCTPTGCTSTHSSAVLVIPWLPIILALIGIPLLAAALSALAVRRAPVVTRRAT